MISNRRHDQIVRELQRRFDEERRAFAAERERHETERNRLLDRLLVLSDKPPLGNFEPELEPPESNIEPYPEAVTWDDGAVYNAG